MPGALFVVCWSSQWQRGDHKQREMDDTFGEFLIAGLTLNSAQVNNCPTLKEKERRKEAVECRKERKIGEGKKHRTERRMKLHNGLCCPPVPYDNLPLL